MFVSLPTIFEDPLPSFSGSPRAATVNRPASPVLDRIKAFDSPTIPATFRRDTLTSVPAVNNGSAEIFRKVEAASSVAQIRKRLIPVSLFGMVSVYSSAFRRWA